MREIMSTEREQMQRLSLTAECSRLAKLDRSQDTLGASFRERHFAKKTKTKTEKPKGPLELLNDRLSEEGDLQLHATKGWRRLTIKRTLAAVITARMKAGETGWSTEIITKVLQGRMHL